jgi:hypothetical protein
MRPNWSFVQLRMPLVLPVHYYLLIAVTNLPNRCAALRSGQLSAAISMCQQRAGSKRQLKIYLFGTL